MPSQKSNRNLRPRVFSGIQPSGALHIGNFLGAIRQWVASQAEKENYFCIVDLHAITLPQDPQILRQSTRQTAALYLASGLDPEHSTIFVQSHVSIHAEGCWLLACVTPLGWLERMIQFKARSSGRTSVGTGLLIYPVLQAADILLYDANEVPVGEDQKQHVELARDIAERFNHLYSEIFVVPKAVLPAAGARIRALNDPDRKMSKSEAHVRGHAVLLSDSPDDIRRSFKRAVTDSGREIIFSEDPSKAGVNNLLEIYEAFTGLSRSVIETRFRGKGYGTLKAEVAEAVIAGLAPLRTRYLALLDDPTELDRILARGAERARSVSGPKLAELKRIIGFLPPGDRFPG